MHKQIVLIHGGTAFDSREDFLNYLRTRDVSADNFKAGSDWKSGVARELGPEYEVLQPKMPNGQNANYEEWKIWFERMVPFLRDGVVLVGHSLGGIFLAKFLSEQNVTVKVGATILIAAPFDNETHESLASFRLSGSLQRLTSQGGRIMLVHSHDDPVVPFAEMGKYLAALPGAESLTFSDRMHFNQEVFPEIVLLIARISAASRIFIKNAV